MKLAKRSVRRNRWGNWRGYEGGKFVREFAFDNGRPDHKPLAALDWLAAPRVVVEVFRGVAYVVASSPGVEVTIRDLDTEGRE